MANKKTSENGASVSAGLEGVVAAKTSISRVEGDIGRLSYRGYDVRDLAGHCSFEEVVYLLWYGELPTQQELETFHHRLAAERRLPEGLLYTMRTLPHDTPPMEALRSCVSLLSVYDPEEPTDISEEANWRRAFRLMGRLPTVVATYARLRTGHEPIRPDLKLGIGESFPYEMTGRRPDELARQAINQSLILHADHELNASTFAARVTVATLSDMYSGITSAIGTLKGPLHGGANEQVMKMLHEISVLERVEPYIKEKLHNKVKIMGFGHRVYQNGDPRAPILADLSRRLGERAGDTLWYEMSRRIEELVRQEKGIHPNVDFYSASVYHTLDIPPDQYTPIFAVSRVAGWIAHMMEQYEDNRLIRPVAEWVGPDYREFQPIDTRGGGSNGTARAGARKLTEAEVEAAEAQAEAEASPAGR